MHVMSMNTAQLCPFLWVWGLGVGFKLAEGAVSLSLFENRRILPSFLFLVCLSFSGHSLLRVRFESLRLLGAEAAIAFRVSYPEQEIMGITPEHKYLVFVFWQQVVLPEDLPCWW